MMPGTHVIWNKSIFEQLSKVRLQVGFYISVSVLANFLFMFIHIRPCPFSSIHMIVHLIFIRS